VAVPEDKSSTVRPAVSLAAPLYAPAAVHRRHSSVSRTWWAE
jgi:hypothetical protein